jgi:hypothetical protein
MFRTVTTKQAVSYLQMLLPFSSLSSVIEFLVTSGGTVQSIVRGDCPVCEFLHIFENDSN